MCAVFKFSWYYFYRICVKIQLDCRLLVNNHTNGRYNSLALTCALSSLTPSYFFWTNLLYSYISRVYTVDTRTNKFKSVGIGAKDSPLTPTVMQGMIMFDNNVADVTTSSTMSPINCTTVVYAFPEEDRVVVGYINEWINAYSFISSKYRGTLCTLFLVRSVGKSALSVSLTGFCFPTQLYRRLKDTVWEDVGKGRIRSYQMLEKLLIIGILLAIDNLLYLN